MAMINRRALLAALLLILRRRRRRLQNQQKRNRKRRFWVRPIFLRRQDQGAFGNLVEELCLHDREYFTQINGKSGVA